MLKIKLKLIGKKHQRSFRIIVQEAREKLRGKFVEDLGWWNPHFDKFEIKKDKVLYWLKKGAQPTDTCYNLLIEAKVIEGKKRSVHKTKRKKKEAEEVEKEKKEKTEGIKEETKKEVEKEVNKEEKEKNVEVKETSSEEKLEKEKTDKK
ncbi:30S ribosomal protein S16 [bacterium]|nr:30S ribosomal protein S16 [bacterium]